MTDESDWDIATGPLLPGESRGFYSPDRRYLDDPNPPYYIMSTLAMLARGASPADRAPQDWIDGIDADALNAPIRAFAFKCLGLRTEFNEKRQSYDWFDVTAPGPDNAGLPVDPDEGLQRCWKGYAQLLIDDLAQQQETPQQAIDRIQQEWRRMAEAQAKAFAASSEDQTYWSPALALAWIMFAGDWLRIAKFLRNGRYDPTDGPELRVIASFLVDADEAANRAANRDFWRAIRRPVGDERRVIVHGRDKGQGQLMEIGPADLAWLDWPKTFPERSEWVAKFESRDGAFYTNILVDKASLKQAFPAAGDAPAPSALWNDRQAQIRESARRVHTKGMLAKERNALIQKDFKRQGLKPPSPSAIKEALKGTSHMKPRKNGQKQRP